jgi:hypothetical protein
MTLGQGAETGAGGQRKTVFGCEEVVIGVFEQTVFC